MNPNTQPDTPSLIAQEDYHRQIAPLVAQARATFPQAKTRFQAGLPTGHSLFVTILLREHGQEETAYVKVLTFLPNQILGLIATHTQILTRFKHASRILLEESDVIDWTITHPDGTEEGNLLGRGVHANAN